MRRTKTGLILEKLLQSMQHRWAFCWNGEDDFENAFDCACCITWCDDDLYERCGCICHQRIEAMAKDRNIHLWLLALEKFDQLPPFFKSYDEKLAYCMKNYEAHKQFRIDHPKMAEFGPCECSDCKFVREHQDREAKNDIPAKRAL